MNPSLSAVYPGSSIDGTAPPYITPISFAVASIAFRASAIISSICAVVMTSGGDITMMSRTARMTRPFSMQWSRQIVPTLPGSSKWSRARLVLDQLDGADQAHRSRLADQRVVLQRLQRLGQMRAGFVAHLFHQPLAADDLDILQRHRAGRRMAGIGEAVIELAALVDEALHHPVADHDGRDRQIARRQPLGHGDEIGGLDAEALIAEPVAGAPETADHLVADQQHVMLACRCAAPPASRSSAG